MPKFKRLPKSATITFDPKRNEPTKHNGLCHFTNAQKLYPLWVVIERQRVIKKNNADVF